METTTYEIPFSGQGHGNPLDNMRLVCIDADGNWLGPGGIYGRCLAGMTSFLNRADEFFSWEAVKVSGGYGNVGAVDGVWNIYDVRASSQGGLCSKRSYSVAGRVAIRGESDYGQVFFRRDSGAIFATTGSEDRTVVEFTGSDVDGFLAWAFRERLGRQAAQRLLGLSAADKLVIS